MTTERARSFGAGSRPYINPDRYGFATLWVIRDEVEIDG